MPTVMSKVGIITLVLTLTTNCAYVSRASVGENGIEPNGASFQPALSENGRFTAFTSNADNLVPNDANATSDIFVRDNQKATNELISRSFDTGGPANGSSSDPDITADGRYVVFSSAASDLVPGDENGSADVFVHDRVTGETERLSVDSSGNETSGTSLGGSVTDDGRYIAFYTAGSFDPLDTNASFDVYLRDRLHASTTLLSTLAVNGTAAGDSFDPVISPVSPAVIWHSPTPGIVATDTNALFDVFGRVEIGGTAVVRQVSAGGDGHSYVGDVVGNPTNPGTLRVAFSSDATNFVAGDTKGNHDIFLWRLDLLGQSTYEQVTLHNADSTNPRLDQSGDVVAYLSTATGIVSGVGDGSTHLYLFDGSDDQLLSETSSGDPANAAVDSYSLSTDGSAVAFATTASNLFPDDANQTADIAIRRTFIPEVANSPFEAAVGETTEVIVLGSFLPGAEVYVSGDGIASISTLPVGSTQLRLTISLAASATPGPRSLTIYQPAPHLGQEAPLGSATQAALNVVSN